MNKYTKTIEEGIVLRCEKCGKPFRWIPRNSTIKPKLCRLCYNKSLLERSNLAARKWKSQQKPGKYIIRQKNGRKAIKSPKQRARANADLWFSRYIRCKYRYKILPDGTVLCKCYITGKIMKAKNIDNGHCFSRSFLLTRYEEDNCRPQNRSSNRFKGESDHYKFRDKLLKEIGVVKFSRIDELRKQEGYDVIEFYEEQAEKYRKLTNELLEKLEIKKWW
jgi:hypothetical protein